MTPATPAVPNRRLVLDDPSVAGIVAERLSPGLGPAAACARFLDLPHCLLLESAAPVEGTGRFSFLAADPFLVLRSMGPVVEQAREDGVRRWKGDPFAVLEAVLHRYPAETVPGLPPFQGGAAGMFAYDLVHHLERVPQALYDDVGTPDLCVGLYDWVVAWDHKLGEVWLVSTGRPAVGAGERAARAEYRAEAVRQRLRRRPSAAADVLAAPGLHVRPLTVSRPPLSPLSPLQGAPGMQGVAGVRSTFSREAYLDAVERTLGHIRAGDIFQANVSQRLERPLREHPFALYRRLRRCSPAPFAAYFDLGQAAVVSASPERFLRLDHGAVETRPIKGTAPRGQTWARDEASKAALLASEKDRAENVMIVDVARNDLSRVCRPHSVEVPELCGVESLGGVHHLVSTVVGRLEEGAGVVDLLRAAFPGASVTGAPKIQAMEIIAAIEPTRRGVYTGALGYVGIDGTMDTSIAIRTFVVSGGTAYLQVGGGIVLDSDPRLEYRETLHKASRLLTALEP